MSGEILREGVFIMNRYKLLSTLLKVFLILSLLGIVYIIVNPIVRNMDKEITVIESNYVSPEDRPVNNLEWIIKQNKITFADSEEPMLIYYSDDRIDVKDFLPKVNDNVVIMEKLFEKNNYEDVLSLIRNVTGVKFSGYFGKTYLDLSDMAIVNGKIIEDYESLHSEDWSFMGEGIIIQGNNQVLVLEKGKDYRGGIYVEKDGEKIPYKGYFEVTSGINPTDYFKINLLEKGKEKFNSIGISDMFPASYELSTDITMSYYFPGDYSAIPIDIPAGYEDVQNIMDSKVIYNKDKDEEFFWKWYYPRLTAAMTNKFNVLDEVSIGVSEKPMFYTKANRIMTRNDSENGKEFFIKGVNLGPALPGKFFTEFPFSEEQYFLWIEQMGELNVNTIRVYTLLPPSFYDALYRYNESSDRKIYLLQEIWPEENPKDNDYLREEYNKEYDKEIEYVVNAIHGNISIPYRDYRAYGVYRSDVSKYLIGYLVGRELEPEEVEDTDIANEGYKYSGSYLASSAKASPTESWLARSCDYALKISHEKYSSKPLVGIVNWPTLDYIEHDSEWNEDGDKSKQFNDSNVVNINNIDVVDNNIAGFFGAYHIYPNYPDFMNNDKKYDDYFDEEGRFRYGGYLKEFMEHHSKYPAVVAEYGISTSINTAHFSPDGYNHGGLDEEKQAEGIIRMTKAIINEGYSGAIIFEWMDEWSKKTWTTEPFMIPYNKNPFWHNTMDPEQNYGLIAYSPVNREKKILYDSKEKTGAIKEISSWDDESYVYLSIENKSSGDKNIEIYLDTVKEVESETLYEFIINIGEENTILVNPGYNWLEGYYKSIPASKEEFERMLQLVNKENKDMYGNIIESKYEDLSNLKEGSFELAQNTVSKSANSITVRIPYGLIGYSDPSQNMVLSDENRIITVLQDQIKIKKSDYLDMEVRSDSAIIKVRYELSTWDMPSYNHRKKDGFSTISEFFKMID